MCVCMKISKIRDSKCCLNTPKKGNTFLHLPQRLSSLRVLLQILQTVRLKQQNLFLTVQEARSPSPSCPPGRFLPGPLPWLVDNHFPCVLLHTGGSTLLLSSASYKDPKPIMVVPPSRPHLSLMISQRPSHLGLGLWHKFWRDNSVHRSSHQKHF